VSAPQLWMVSRDSIGSPWKDPVEVVDHECAYPAWAPDGESLVCEAEEGGWIRISREGEILQRFDFSTMGLRRVGAPNFSPDGSRIYFHASPEVGPRGVWWIPEGGGDATLVVTFDDPSNFMRPFLSVGREYLYLTIGQTDGDIRVVDLEW
ncbi:MAG: hypothetical protein N2B05_12260, partial [Gemmatimonadales bacterium]